MSTEPFNTAALRKLAEATGRKVADIYETEITVYRLVTPDGKGVAPEGWIPLIDWGQAWEIVVGLRDRSIVFEMYSRLDGQCGALLTDITPDGGVWNGHADTPQEAICRAALKCIEGEA